MCGEAGRGRVLEIFNIEIDTADENCEPSDFIDWLVGLRDRVLAALEHEA